MAMEFLTTGGYIDGEQKEDTGVADVWYGGQPAVLTAAGCKRANVTSNAVVPTIYGLFKNARAYDERAQVQLNDANIALAAAPINVTVYVGPGKVRFFTDGTDAAPFVYPGAGAGWAVGDEIFASTTGFYDNVPANVSDMALGKVIKAPTSATDDMIVLYYGARTLN